VSMRDLIPSSSPLYRSLCFYLPFPSLVSTALLPLLSLVALTCSLTGGDAELELVDSLDPFSEGIVFSVRPPKKSWKNISNLSGGEKTLSSLALVFALHHFKPTPLYVMDEIDAALVRQHPSLSLSLVSSYLARISKMFPLWRITSNKELRMHSL
jgi:hypothetical protein